MNPAVQGSSLTEGKRSKRSKKTGENGDADGDTSTVSIGVDQDSLARSTSAVAEAEEDDDTTWSADISEAAVRARMQDLTDGAKTMT